MVKITSESFGQTRDGLEVTRYSLTNSSGICVKILDYGGTITNILVPDKYKDIGDITLGFDNLPDYETSRCYFGAVCGRVANLIKDGQFTLDGVQHQLSRNYGANHLHGGNRGFNKKIWSAKVENNQLVLTLVSPDGEENYPGNLTTTVTYSLDDEGCLTLDYRATTDGKTLVNLTNHAYFNLAGHQIRHLRDHAIAIPAESYLPVHRDFVKAWIPTGEILPVAGTEFDLRTPVNLVDRIASVQEGDGFNNNFCVGEAGTMKLAARVEHQPSGRYLECHTTQPGLQLYTCCNLSNTFGKDMAMYSQFGAFCLEAQLYPDSVNNPNFPSTLLKPGEIYSQTTVYKFGLL